MSIRNCNILANSSLLKASIRAACKLWRWCGRIWRAGSATRTPIRDAHLPTSFRSGQRVRPVADHCVALRKAGQRPIEIGPPSCLSRLSRRPLQRFGDVERVGSDTGRGVAAEPLEDAIAETTNRCAYAPGQLAD